MQRDDVNMPPESLADDTVHSDDKTDDEPCVFEKQSRDSPAAEAFAAEIFAASDSSLASATSSPLPDRCTLDAVADSPVKIGAIDLSGSAAVDDDAATHSSAGCCATMEVTAGDGAEDILADNRETASGTVDATERAECCDLTMPSTIPMSVSISVANELFSSDRPSSPSAGVSVQTAASDPAPYRQVYSPVSSVSADDASVQQRLLQIDADDNVTESKWLLQGRFSPISPFTPRPPALPSPAVFPLLDWIQNQTQQPVALSNGGRWESTGYGLTIQTTANQQLVADDSRKFLENAKYSAQMIGGSGSSNSAEYVGKCHETTSGNSFSFPVSGDHGYSPMQRSLLHAYQLSACPRQAWPYGAMVDGYAAQTNSSCWPSVGDSSIVSEPFVSVLNGNGNGSGDNSKTGACQAAEWVNGKRLAREETSVATLLRDACAVASGSTESCTATAGGKASRKRQTDVLSHVAKAAKLSSEGAACCRSGGEKEVKTMGGPQPCAGGMQAKKTTGRNLFDSCTQLLSGANVEFRSMTEQMQLRLDQQQGQQQGLPAARTISLPAVDMTQGGSC